MRLLTCQPAFRKPSKSIAGGQIRSLRKAKGAFRIAYRGMARLADQLGIQCDARVYRAADAMAAPVDGQPHTK